MAILAPKDGILSAPVALIHGMLLLAERQAELTALWLDAVGHPASKPLGVPPAFLLELGAVLQIGQWELTGAFNFLTDELPSYREAADELSARAQRGPSEFHDLNAAQLSRRVMVAWLRRFAWHGPTIIGADIVLGDCNEDDLVEQLAQFLWRNRQEIMQLRMQGICDEEK